jgi:predicted transposase YdaD
VKILLGLGLMVLTVLPGDEMVTETKGLLQKSETFVKKSAILDLIIIAIAYDFPELSRNEVSIMMGVDLKKARIVREAMNEGSEKEHKMVIETFFGDTIWAD